jgi:creatinine amidohydrolase
VKFEEMTTIEADRAREAGVGLLLPVGSVEPHGPHLPLSTDILIAQEMARRAAARLDGAGVPALVLPPFPYSTVEFSDGFAGAIGLTPSTSSEALTDLLVAVLEQGYRTVTVVNAHLEPGHIEGLRGAVSMAASRAGRSPVFPDITRRALAARLSEEFRSGSCHAGRFETSLVMAVRPDLVREEIRKGLPAVEISLVDAIRKGKRNFRAAGIDRAYCGDPAAATAEEGHALYDVMAEIVFEEILRSMQSRAAKGIH